MLSPAWGPPRGLARHSPELSPVHPEFGAQGIYPLTPVHCGQKLQCKRPALLNWAQLERTAAYPVYAGHPETEMFRRKVEDAINKSLKLGQFQGRTLNNQFIHEADP